MKLRKIQGKKAQFESILFGIIMIVIIGILLFFLSHFNKEIYDSFNEVLTESKYNDSEATDAIQKFQTIEGSNIWDYAFLAIFIGIMIQMLLLSFATRINVAFYWIFSILAIVILFVGVVMSNMWMKLVEQPEFVTTITRFPITNTLLGTYYPTVITMFILIAMIVLFGKPPGQT